MDRKTFNDRWWLSRPPAVQTLRTKPKGSAAYNRRITELQALYLGAKLLPQVDFDGQDPYSIHLYCSYHGIRVLPNLLQNRLTVGGGMVGGEAGGVWLPQGPNLTPEFFNMLLEAGGFRIVDPRTISDADMAAYFPRAAGTNPFFADTMEARDQAIAVASDGRLVQHPVNPTWFLGSETDEFPCGYRLETGRVRALKVCEVQEFGEITSYWQSV